MKYAVAIAVASLAISTASYAEAGEGAGDPFPFRGPGFTVVTPGFKGLVMRDQDPFQFHAAGQAVTAGMRDRLVATNGSEGTVQSANSLPRDFGASPTQLAELNRDRRNSRLVQRALPTRNN